MTQQFDTFDNKMDRREIVILFEKLGEGLPDAMANEVRAKFLESLMPLSTTGMAHIPFVADPDECYPSGAYFLFTALTGVLGVPIGQAASRLDQAVKRKSEWMKDNPVASFVLRQSGAW